MKAYAFVTVDVFTDRRFGGNPLAVFPDARGMSDADMQSLAAEFNLSETTFLSRPRDATADYHVRIFTSTRELPFAGHPTLGSCHAWLALGHQPKGETVIQECGAGLVRVKRDGARLAFAAPPLQRSGEVAPELRSRIAVRIA